MNEDRGSSIAPLRAQLLAECNAMARYALASGLNVPADVVQALDDAWAAQEDTRSASAGEPALLPEGDEETPHPDTRTSDSHLVRLTRAHEELAGLVAPATPRAILLLGEPRRSRLFGVLGPVRLVRHMLIVVIVLLAAFVVLAMSPDVNDGSGDIFKESGGDVLVDELFFLTAAGIGAAFAALFTAYRYITEGTYDPTYESSYWVRFILGLMAGVILPSLIPLGEGEESRALTKPVLALLGGFSAALLYEILDRLVETVESLVKGDSRDVRAARIHAAVSRAAEQAAHERLALLGELVRLQADAKAGVAPERLASDLDRIMDALMPGAHPNMGRARVRADDGRHDGGGSGSAGTPRDADGEKRAPERA